MSTNASPNISADASRNNESNHTDGDAAVSPIRKEISRSKSLEALEDGGLGWRLYSPTEEVKINPKEIYTDNNEALYFPPARASSSLATPVQSNKRKKQQCHLDHEDAKIGNDSGQKSGIDEQLLKSISFENFNRYAKQDIFLGEENYTEDDAYGQYLNTSIFEESPNLKRRQSISSDQSKSANNDAACISGESKEKLKDELCSRKDYFTALSIPELPVEKQKKSSASANPPGHRRHISFMSELSFESDYENDDESISETPRDDSQKILQLRSNQRLSLTVDMETGSSPKGASLQFHRGQHAMRRVYSNQMMDAQSPRVRRRRALSYNVEQLRKGFLNNMEQLKSKRISLQQVKGASDLQHNSKHSIDDIEEAIIPQQQLQEQHQQQQSITVSSRNETDRFTDRKRRNRYNVEQKNVRVPNEKQSRNYHDEVQYRLSAITPIELRRRRHKNNFNGGIGIDEDVTDKNSTIDNDDIKHGGIYADGKCNQCLASVGNFLTEMAILIASKSKQNYSVGLVNKFLYWTFRKNFFVVLLSAAGSFYLFTVTFALFIYLIGKKNPKCIHVNGVDFEETRTQFVDAFALSWTTFSTVGYGLVYPATSATMPENFNIAKECTGISIITTMEAFVGILFSGVWGAICFAKLSRVSSFAQVSFSDAIIIKYGTGVTGVAHDEEYEEVSSDDDDPNRFSENSYVQSKLPYPILEFRIANRLYRQRGGEIIDASVNIVASMEESQATRSIRNGAGMEPKIRRRGRRPRISSAPRRNKRLQDDYYSDVRGDDEIMTEANIQRAQKAARDMIVAYTSGTIRMDGETDDENCERQKDRSSTEQTKSGTRNTNPFPNQIFAKLNMESLEHPFFKRVWNVRHVLDLTSPLLKQEAKELIRINNGHWPKELNNATAVRASIHFDQILVSFSGTSNVDANSVYSQKAYNFDDVCVGYAFCNMLYREPNGCIGVDQNLLSDVKEQTGGGGEGLLFRKNKTSDRSLPDILIL